MGRSAGAIRLRLYQSSPFLLPTHHMTPINIESTVGNFKFKAVGEVDDTVRDILANAGALQVVQRSPVTSAEKTMAGYDKRPAGFKRTDIPFNEANAKILTDSLSKVIVYGPTGPDGKTPEYPVELVVEVSQHFPGEGAEPAFAEEKRFIKAYLAANGGKTTSGESRTVDTFSENRGIETTSDAAAWEDDKEFLARVREWKRAEDAKRAAQE